MNQPSRSAVKMMLEYFKKVSVPRILAEQKKEKDSKEAS
jgi:hypothetical protein